MDRPLVGDPDYYPNRLQSVEDALDLALRVDRKQGEALEEGLLRTGEAIFRALQDATPEARPLMLALVQMGVQALRETCEMLARQTKEGL